MTPKRATQGLRLAPWVGMGLTLALTGAGWIANAAAMRSATESRLGQQERRLTDLEVEQRTLSQNVTEMKADLKWIRRALEQPPR